MLSPSGKVEWFCPECKSPDIVQSISRTLYTYTDSKDNIFECNSCGFFADWRCRLKKSTKTKD